MAKGFDSASRVMSGTWGELWLDDEPVAEVYGFQAKVAISKEEVPMCGVMWVDHKVKNIKGTGSVRMRKVNSRMAKLIGDKMRMGQDPRYTIISALNDKDAYGAERVAVKGVSFDDLTIADWEAGVFGNIEAPFTFVDYQYLDMV